MSIQAKRQTKEPKSKPLTLITAAFSKTKHRSSMTYNIALASATLGVALAELPSNENLATYGLTLDEYELIKSSESPYDFVGLEDEDQQQLWLDAAVFSYEVAAAAAAESGSSSMSFMPYVICSTVPDISGAQRLEQINFTFANTSGVSASDYYLHDAAIMNVENTTCGVIRAYNDTVALVYAENPGVEEYMSVQPHHQSMKMNNSTVAIFEQRFAAIESGDFVLPTHKSGWFQYVNVLGTSSILCPGVQDFRGEDVPEDEIVDSLKNFITEDDGSQIKAASFFYNRVNGDNEGVQTDRMTYWAEIIAEVDGMTKEDGTNYCRDDVLDENFVYLVDMETVSVHAKINTDQFLKLAEDEGFVQNHLEKCLMYLAMGLALNPMICWTEPQTFVTTLCPDGNSDLTTCPEPDTETPESSSCIIDGTLGSIVSGFSFFLVVWSSLW